MKKFDVKKFLVLIVILAVVGGLIFLVGKSILGGKDATKDVTNDVESVYSKYIFGLTYGFTSTYDGVNILYEENKTTVSDLADNVLLNTAALYASDNLDNTILSGTLKDITERNKIDLSKSNVYSGEAIREAMKILFNIDYKDTLDNQDVTFAYNFSYLDEYDVYIRTLNANASIGTAKSYMDYKVEDVIEKRNKVVMTVRVAYVFKDISTYIYTSDYDGNKIVIESEEAGITEDKMNEFDKYTITFVKNDKNYSFESIEKSK